LQAPDFFTHPERIPQTERYRRLARLDAYYRGTQCDGLPDWYEGLNADQEEVPLRLRKPCIIYPLPKAAVNQAVRFSVGEGRFPDLEVEDVEPDEAIEPRLAVSEDDAATLTAFVSRLVEQSCLKSTARTLMRHGLAVSSAPAVIAIRRGRFAIDTPRAQDCQVEFHDDDPDGDVARMVWCYQFDKQVTEQGRIVQRPHFFRRDYTATETIVYRDAPVEMGKPIEWIVDAEATAKTRHDYGFCPVVWIRNMPESHCSDIDGTSLYGGMFEEFDALNFALSQQHRGINYFGTPQAYETNVGEDEQPATVLRPGRPTRGEDPVKGGAFGVNPKPTRRKAPDEIWSYKGDATVDVLETSGKAFDVAEKHAKNVRARVLEAINVVLLDPETAMQKDLSGVAIQRVYASFLALVDEMREHWWEHGFAKILGLMMRIVAVTSGKGLLLAGAVKSASILKRFMVDTEVGPMWIAPTITPSWGDYFSPSPEDTKAAVEATVAAKDGHLITPQTATKYVAPYFGVDDAEAEAEEAEAESLTAAEDALATEEAKAKAMTPEPEADPAPANVEPTDA